MCCLVDQNAQAGLRGGNVAGGTTVVYADNTQPQQQVYVGKPVQTQSYPQQQNPQAGICVDVEVGGNPAPEVEIEVEADTNLALAPEVEVEVEVEAAPEIEVEVEL